MKANHRIDVYLVTHGQTQRELVEIGGNDYGDVVLTFAEGDKVQFTPREKGLSVPTVESVKGVYQNKLPRLSTIRVTGGVVWGDLRIIPRPERAAIIETQRRRARQDVTQSEAAALCGKTLKTVQRWDMGNGTPEGYPGRGDAVTLRAWAARRQEAETVKRALKNTVHVDCQKLSGSDRWQADMKRRGAAGRRQGDW